MKKLSALIFAGLMAMSVPAFAEEKKADAADPSVKLASVGIPVFHGMTVTNYLFLSIKINLTPKADETKLRDMEPYFRDALVRAAHKTSFAQPDHDDRLDIPRFQSVMVGEFTKIAGPGTIQSVEIVSQSPKKH
ncbi:hypothetical protein [Asticcacaulis solisilvae]|uniref:hypothetical protein n=1 Tax=Asticcacaulis solisilvae TaxID=1217274 RepID=UPI003FD81116